MSIQYACIHTQVDHPSLPSYIKHEDTAILSSSSHLKMGALSRHFQNAVTAKRCWEKNHLNKNNALTFNFNQSEGEWLAGFKI